MSAMLVISLPDEARFAEARQRLAAAGLGTLETYTPRAPPEDADAPASRLPRLVLLAGLLGAALGYAMQVYADTRSYPLDIGGRPDFSWPAFVPIAFELGILAAVAAGFFGFLAANGLPRPYHPVDEAVRIREASRADWLIVLHPAHSAAIAHASALVAPLHPLGCEELAG